ncbi:SPOR domain-containing protein [Clostridium sp.]
MRYTRYNYKPPRKKNNFMFVIILVIIAAIALGTIFSKLLPKNIVSMPSGDKTTKTGLEKDSVDVSKTTPVNNIKDYVAIQCGIFSNKENALILKNSLMKSGTPFIIEENNLIRVFFGIYPKEGTDIVTKQLTASKIVYTKINFQLTPKDSTSAQTNEMISADLKILNKLSEKDTSAFDTVELKKWLIALEGTDEKSASYASMTEIKKYLTALPAEMKKEKAEEGYIYIYKFIKKVSAL